MTRLQVKVTASMLNIRSGAGTGYRIVGVLRKNDVVIVNKISGSWYKLENGKGWIGKSYTKTVKNLSTTKPATKPPAKKTSSKPTTAKSNGIDRKIVAMLYASLKSRNSDVNATTRLFGAPFQFTKHTDFRLSDSQNGLGRKYLEAIVSESPIVYIMPGKPNYLPDLSDSERKSLTTFFSSKKVDSDNKSILDKILKGKDARYFGFMADYSVYMRYVNLLCRTSAVYMGLGNKTAPGSTTTYKHYDWGNYRYESTHTPKKEKKKSMFDLAELKTNVYQALFGSYQYTQFYVEPNTSFNESSSNNTSTSKLEGAFDSAEGIVKELAFLTSTAAVKGADAFRDSFATGMNDISEKMLKNGNENFFTRLLGMSSQVLSGSNVIFPEIWGDAAYNKSYNITINLVSPYGSKESIYLNIIVPLMHLLALTLPRQTSANAYGSPFLVKMFAKGWFSCEMGIIDSISIEKGGQGAWSINGLPTEVKVSMSVKDLYTNLMITPNSRPDLFFENQGLIEFLAVTCGVDLSKPQFATKIEAIFATIFNTVGDIPDNLARDIMQNIRRSIDGLFRL